MPEWAATLLVGVGVVLINWVITSNAKNFVYGQLTQRVEMLDDRTVDHGRRITNIESVVSGEDGHGERLVRLEHDGLERARSEKKHGQS